MSRRVKVAVAASLALMAIGAGIWAWFLSRHGLEYDSEWSGVLQGFTALLGVPALVIGVLALRTPGGDGTDGKKSATQETSQVVKIGRIKADGPVDVIVRVDNQR